MVFKKWCALSVYIIAAIITTCVVNPASDTGGASETVAVIITDSTFSGSVKNLDDNGEPVANTRLLISVYAIDYLPLILSDKLNFTISTATNQSGAFTIKHRGPGLYNLYLRDTASGFSTFIDSVVVTRNILDTIVDSLAAGMVVGGALFLVDSIQLDTTKAVRYRLVIAGTGFSCRTDSSGLFSFGTLPQGSYNVKTLSSSTSDSIGWLSNIALNQLLNKNKGFSFSVLNPHDTLDLTVYLKKTKAYTQQKYKLF
jgi:hypothetical protein